MMSDIILTVFAALASAIAYGIIGYAKNLAADPVNTKWSTKKFIITIVYSLIVGAIMLFLGIPITQETFAANAIMYGYLTIMLEKLVEAVDARLHIF